MIPFCVSGLPTIPGEDLGGSAPTPIGKREQALALLATELAAESAHLAKMRERLAQLEKVNLIGRLVGNFAHDLNNVLSVVSNVFSLLQFDVRDAENQEFLKNGERALDRGGRLVRQLLDYLRSGFGEAAHVCVAGVVADTKDMLSHLLGPNIELTIVTDDELWQVITRRDTVQSVLFNLAANARDAMPEGGTLRISLFNCRNEEQQRQLPRGEFLCLTVADTGCGMSPETLAKAGQAFFTTKSKGSGTGLGLHSAFELAAANAGCVTIDSSPGCGTTIKIYLARACISPHHSRQQTVAADQLVQGGATILLVHSNEGVRTVLADLLRARNYLVTEVGSMQAALGISLATTRTDLLVTDVTDGQPSFGLVQELRQTRPDLPVIYLNGGTELMASPADLALWTPVFEPLLARAIAEQLGRLPAVVLTQQALRASSRLRKRLRNPATRDLFDLWHGLAHSQNKLPALEEMPQFYGVLSDNAYLITIDSRGATPRFHVTRLGPALIDRLGRDMTGEIISGSDEAALGSTHMAYQRCLTGRAFFDYAVFSLGDVGAQRMERLLVPVSNDERSVTHLIGLTTFDDQVGPRHETYLH